MSKSSSKGSTPSTTTPKPRVGGTSKWGGEDIVWTGGSNIPSQVNKEPTAMNCYRPSDFKSAQSIDEKICKGLGEEQLLYTADEVNKVGNEKLLLTTWIEALKRFLEECGMDTVFRMPATGNGDGLNDTIKELYLLVDWGTVMSDRELLKTWITWLNNTGDTQDVYNLRRSFKKIHASLSPSMQREVAKTVKATTTGPELLMIVLSRHVEVSASIIRSMVGTLTKLSIDKEPGENVDTFSDKVHEQAQIISGSGLAPGDLPLLVASCFIKSTVSQFALKANMIHDQADKGTLKNWNEEVLEEVRRKYRSLLGQGLWGPKTSQRESEVAMTAEISSL